MQSKQIVIVGGSYGIGLGITRRCVAAGARVTVVSRTQGELGELESAVQWIAGDALQDVPADGSASDWLPEVVDGFVYCPGSIQLGPLRGVSLSTLRDDFELNVLGAVKYLQLALLRLKKSSSASCVFFSTIAVAQGLPMHTSVAAAKGALEALVRTWAAELAPTIRVNCIAPALTDTRLAAKFLSSDAKREAMAAKYALGRVGTIDDIAAAAEFLLGPDSSWMTGQVLHVDGGLSAVRK